MQLETGSEYVFNRRDYEFEEPPQLVLQRNQISIGGFFTSNGIFSLTVVCAVLGVLSNTYVPESGE